MIRDIYLNRDEFELKFHPKRPKNGHLIELNHPEAFINDKVKCHSYPTNFQNNVPGMVSFECNLLLTNPAHDGIWLFMDNDNDKIMFPGGYIQEEDWEYVKKNPYYVIYSALIRAMSEIHPLFRNTAIVDPNLTFIRNANLTELKDLLGYVIGRNRFQLNNPQKEHLFYYQYWLSPFENGKYIPLESMKIYLLLEVTEPIENIPRLVNYSDGYYVWYSRGDHSLNYHYRADRKLLFNSTYNNDIRVSDSGLDMLTNIFKTEEIFGKLDIY